MFSEGRLVHHSDTSSVRLDKREVVETYYHHGLSDVLNVVFYGMVWIIIHALLQEYIWEVGPSLGSQLAQW